MSRHGRRLRQRGSAMVEFAVVGPVLTLLGLASVQYGLMFFNKNHLNHAAFMAARAGSVRQADPDQVRTAFVRALTPIYGGGRNTVELAASFARAQADVGSFSRIEILNPTRESFDDWSSTELEDKYGKRAIPNAHLTAKDPAQIGPSSGQSIQDANLLKLRVTYGYQPRVPLMGLIYRKYLAWLDPGTDAFNSSLIAQGRIPMVAQATVQMHSDALEPGNPVSSPGGGNNGSSTDPGDPPTVETPPPECGTIGCTTPIGPPPPGADDGEGGGTEPPAPCDPSSDPSCSVPDPCLPLP